MWADSHCHPQKMEDAPDQPSLQEQITRARAAGVTRYVCVGTDRASSIGAIEAAQATEGMLASVGLHPHEAQHGLEGLEELCAAPEVRAIGECGLDYFYEHSPKGDQRRVFAEQIGWANAHDLALIIHTRDAWDDTFAVLKEVGVPSRTVFHCFSGGVEEATKALDLGAYLSFSGIITFKNASDLRSAAAVCPLDRLLVETDSPWLTPVPHRGKPNEPAMIPLVGAGVANAKSVDVESVENATFATFGEVFGLA